MKSMQRQVGKFKKRTTDDSDVSVLFRDFNEADLLLAKLIDSTTEWRDAWTAILNTQDRMVGEFEFMYTPIVGTSGGAESAVLTPDEITSRTTRLHSEYSELRLELAGELSAVDDSMIRPAMAAKDYLAPMKRTIKKREDRKLDFEHAQSRYDGYAKKMKRTERDNVALAKAEADLATVREVYNGADDTLRERLPQLLAAVYSLLPRLLSSQIVLQNTILANYYTLLHNFSQDHQFQSPPPPMEQVVLEWEQSLLPVREELESFRCLANGKATQLQPSQAPDRLSPGSNNNTRPVSRASSYTSVSGRRSSTDTHYTTEPEPKAPPPTVSSTKPRIPSISSASSTLAVPSSSGHYLPPKTPPSPASSPSALSASSPGVHSAPASSYLPSTTPMTGGFSPAGPRTADYFSSAHRSRHPSLTPNAAAATIASTPNPWADQQTSSSIATAAAAAAGKKKKPPPPPKPKAISSDPPAVFVTALYDFAGQSAGDLEFSEGDRIRVVHKTDSLDDWWDGELRGVKGSFPANYVE